MKRFFGVAFLILWSALAVAQTPEVDPCTLIDKANLVKIFGEIKEGPKTKEGLQKEKICEWTNMSGSWVEVSAYTSERWGMRKGMANDPADLSGLGEEAFTAKRGTDAEICVRKGKLMLEVRTSSGRDVAKQVAEMAVKKMP